MAFASILKITGWGNPRSPALSGARGPSPLHRGGLRAPFLLGLGVAGREAPTGQPTGTAPPRAFHQIRDEDTRRTNSGTKTSSLSELQFVVEDLSKSKITTLLKLACTKRGE